MPRYLTIKGKRKLVATEKELLAFANKVRKAGGGDVIKALLPSVPADPSYCLIANALNFQCDVMGGYGPKCNTWAMEIQGTEETKKLVLKIAKKLNLRAEIDPYTSFNYRTGKRDQYYACAILLPAVIGNCAYAFDEGVAFQHLVEDY